MARFTPDNQPSGRGRKVGSKNKRSQFSNELTATALAQLEIAVEQGEQWAVETILKRTHAPLKAVTPVDSLDGEYLALKMKELNDFEARLIALEDNEKQ